MNEIKNIEGYLASTTCDVPNDGPVVFLTRDYVTGVALPVIDVWIAKPQRRVDAEDGSIVWRCKDGQDGYSIGVFTEAAVIERFGIAPLVDECLVLDNVKVN